MTERIERAQRDHKMTPPETLLRLGHLLQNRRKEARLSRTLLASRAGISESTLKNLESGRHRPNLSTLNQLCSIPELKLSLAEIPQLNSQSTLDVEIGPPLNCWLAPGFDPVAMTRELSTRLTGRGGHIEQSFLYLDPKSAECWFAIANWSGYAAERESIPLSAVAQRIRQCTGNAGLDVIALGCGDGKKDVRLVHLLLPQGEVSDLRLYLLDISQPLLAHAYKHAADSLSSSRGVSVTAVQGNFHHLPWYTQLLYTPQRTHRRRIVCMFGCTFGNLENEVRFVQDSLVGLSAGDMLLLHIGQIFAPANQSPEIVKKDPRLSNRVPEKLRAIEREWLTAPIEQYSRPIGAPLPELEVSTSLDTNSCPVPGSYAVKTIVSVKTPKAEARQFLMEYIKRYDGPMLAECLRNSGWDPVELWCEDGVHDMILLLRLRG